jgi:hypothetical protein
MISVTVRLSQVDESLLYRSEKNGEVYLNLLLTPEKDRFGNFTVVQPVPRERYLQGECSPPCGSWKELAKSGQQPGKGLDLSKFRKPADAPQQPPAQGQPYEPGPARESYERPLDALDAAKQQAKPPGFDEVGV